MTKNSPFPDTNEMQYWNLRAKKLHDAIMIKDDRIFQVMQLAIDLRNAYLLGKEDGVFEWNNNPRD